jgi:hypothetical protein
MTSAEQSTVENVSVSLRVTIMAMMVLAATIVAAVAATAGAIVIAVMAVWTLRLSAVKAAAAVGVAVSSLRRLTGHTVHHRHFTVR